MDKKMYALADSGHLIWELMTEDKISASPAIGSDGTVCIGSHDGCLYAIGPGEGR